MEYCVFKNRIAAPVEVCRCCAAVQHLVQARNRCSKRCCGIRNYASDVRPTDALAAGCKKINKKEMYKPSDPGGSSLVRNVKCLTFKHLILGKRHNRAYPGQNATQRGTYLFTAWKGHS